MQTYIRPADEAAMEPLPVGATVDASPANLIDAQYWCIEEPGADEPVRILVPWECPRCGAPQNWACVEVTGGRIVSIEAVSLSRAVFRGSHYVSPDVVDTAADLGGTTAAALMPQPEQALAILRDRLP